MLPQQVAESATMFTISSGSSPQAVFCEDANNPLTRHRVVTDRVEEFLSTVDLPC